MKNLQYILLISLILFFANVNHAFSQNASVIDVNAQLRTLFSPLLRPVPSKLFLYDMSMKFSDSVFYQTICHDTLETEMWYKIYEEMYHAAYDTTPYLDIDTIITHATSFYQDTIPIGIINYAFYKLIDSSMTTDTYFNFDTINDLLSDKSTRPGFPYLDSNMFIAAPLLASCNFTNPVFRVDPQFIFYDSFNSGIYAHGEGILKIDFGDGNGWITFNPNIITNWSVSYNSSGEKLIQTAVFDAANPTHLLRYSQSTIVVIAAIPSVPPDQIFNLPGITAGYYIGCNGQINSGKTIVYLSGFDLTDFIPAFNRSISKIYTEMISYDKVVQLKNEGYNFLVVDWDNSRIDLRFNALYLVNLLEYLKCNLTDDQQFVIIGESMGGLIARYALTYMETEYYINKNTSPFFEDILDLNNIPYLLLHPDIVHLPAQWCKMDKKHNTRLLITLDSPHQGANIPLAAQLAYRSVMNAFGVVNGFYAKLGAQALNLFLDGQAAQQMLIYHVDTKPIIGPLTYSSKNDKDVFFDQLNSLGNYPNYAKVVALSNGSLSGQNQTNYHTSSLPPRVPNDRLIDLGCELYGRVLWIKIPIFGGDLKAFTNPNGNGNVLTANAGTYGVKIKLRLFGIKVLVGYNSLFAISEDVANGLPYCTSPGGFIGDETFMSASASSNGFNLSNNYWIFNLFHYNHTVDGAGCVTFDSHLGLNGFASINFDYHLCSDGLQFCFIPVQSALDYGTLGSTSLNHDIQNESILTKLGLVKADVIIGYPGYDAGINKRHTGSFTEPFRNNYIFNLTGLPASPSKPYTYYSCVGVNDNVERGIINNEIGDEELYLENVTLPWNGSYQAQFDIHVNERNPHYEYPSYISSNPYINVPGIYSKEDNYIIDATGQASFYIDGVNSPTGFGLIYAPPYSGPYQKKQQQMQVCCTNYIGNRLFNNDSQPINQSHLNVFPNPNNGNELMLDFQFNNNGRIIIEILNLLGEKVICKSLKISDATAESHATFDLSSITLTSGFYMVRISNGIELLSSKLLISKF